ncbi:MAG TPA: type II toxin-antitoxin system RelE/ParE family toxin [Terriglobia bacterium]|nr:type II toxin-antitoxin system RelE/ParE family toxin [Terriglobia bacterium]
MSKVRIARSAVTDLDEIWLYIAQRQSIEAAERAVDLLTSKFSLLAACPGIGRRRPELGPEIRSFPVHNYRIYYRQEKRGIVRILYVRHAKREESRMFG